MLSFCLIFSDLHNFWYCVWEVSVIINDKIIVLQYFWFSYLCQLECCLCPEYGGVIQCNAAVILYKIVTMQQYQLGMYRDQYSLTEDTSLPIVPCQNYQEFLIIFLNFSSVQKYLNDDVYVCVMCLLSAIHYVCPDSLAPVDTWNWSMAHKFCYVAIRLCS